MAEIQAAVDGAISPEQAAKLRQCLAHIDELLAHRTEIEQVILLIAELFSAVWDLLYTLPGLDKNPMTAIWNMLSKREPYNPEGFLEHRPVNENKVLTKSQALELFRKRGHYQDTTQTVEIYFNIVGRYIPPHYGEVVLTTEEREELRKKEERKDRLHQNYLRRKANGKQREYEERTKSEKRKKMEEKKAALRAEDMAKGVYILTGSLPHLEPQRAAPPHG